MMRSEDKNNTNIGGVDINYVIKQSKTLVTSNPVPKEEFRYRKEKVVTQNGPLSFNPISYIRNKFKK